MALDILGSEALSGFRRIVVCGSEALASRQFVAELQGLGIERIHLERLSRDVGSNDFGAFVDLLRELKAIRPALVHTHSAKPFLLAGLASWMIRVPRRVHTLHGIQFHKFAPPLARSFYYFISQLGSLFYHRIVSVNAHYLRFFPLARARRAIQVVPNGIALPGPLPDSVTDRSGEFSILFAGRLDQQKDPLFVLDVAAAIKRHWKSQRVPHFYLAGSGPLSDQVIAGIAARGLSGRVTALGWVKDLGPHYASADVLFLPSRWEACGLVLIEAAARGCPAVATNVEGVPEVIRDGQNGLLFEQGDVDAACARLARLAEDEPLRRGLGERARADAQGRDHARMVAGYLEVYRDLGLAL